MAPAGLRVLDLGPGSEASPLALHAHGFDVDGCDVWDESTMRAHAAKLPDPGPRLAAYDGERLPYPDQYFVVVASMAVLEHVLDPNRLLLEADRVLKPGGLQVHLAPNWAGPHVVVHAAATLLSGHGRYWQYSTWADVLAGCVRTLYWPVRARYGRKPFILVWPRMRGGRIQFERSDDDCVHLCCPSSLWRWFVEHQYSVISRTAGTGQLWLARLVNRFAPAVATSNAVVARKNEVSTHYVAPDGG